jgi:hypothetical protein
MVPQAILKISPWGEATSWSAVYRLDLEDGTHLFVKGTPRRRKEVLVTQRLGLLVPGSVPDILIFDLQPTASWQWFLLEDAGESPSTLLTVPQMIEVAQALGQLQHSTEQDLLLPSILSDCSAGNLLTQVLTICRWALTEQTLSWREELLYLVHSLEQASHAFIDLAAVLDKVPPTIIHGDLWQGNLTITQNKVRFLDWGDALWGIGGTSLVHLSLSQQCSEQTISLLWDAYQQGRGLALSQDYRQTCSIALDMIDLVVDQAIASSCGQGPTVLPGLLPGLRRIVAWIHGSHNAQVESSSLIL